MLLTVTACCGPRSASSNGLVSIENPKPVADCSTPPASTATAAAASSMATTRG